MMRGVRMLLPLWFVVPGTLAAASYRPPTKLQLAEVLATPASSTAERLQQVTAPLVGAPYVLSPLGEGSGEDADPRLRYDAFDCTTFVETALALGLAGTVDDVQSQLDRIRYAGAPAYLHRRHFPEAEWIPGMRELGLVVDITRDVGGETVATETKAMSPVLWRKHKNKHAPKLPDSRIPDGLFMLAVWPLRDAAAHAHDIPPGTILNVVRVDFASMPVRVSHQGLVIQKDGQLYLRHAADRLHHRVVDEPIDAFFTRMRAYQKWPIAGVNLLRVTLPAATPTETPAAATTPR